MKFFYNLSKQNYAKSSSCHIVQVGDTFTSKLEDSLRAMQIMRLFIYSCVILENDISLFSNDLSLPPVSTSKFKKYLNIYFLHSFHLYNT